MKYTEIPSESFYKHLNKNIGDSLMEKIEDSYGYLAGGACRAWFANEEISDYDFFFEDEEDYKVLEKELFTNSGEELELLKIKGKYKDQYELKFQSDNALSLVNKKTNAKIQLVKIRFSSLEDQIKVFDFSVCSAAYNIADKCFITHPQFFDDLKDKRLRVLPNEEGLLYPLAEIERIARYSRKGYYIKGVDIVTVILFIAQRLENIHTYEDFKTEINGMVIQLIDGVFEESSLKLEDDFNPSDLFESIQTYIEKKNVEREE